MTTARHHEGAGWRMPSPHPKLDHLLDLQISQAGSTGEASLKSTFCRKLIDVRWKICHPWVEKTRGQRKVNSLATVWVLFYAFFFLNGAQLSVPCTNEDYDCLRGDRRGHPNRAWPRDLFGPWSICRLSILWNSSIPLTLRPYGLEVCIECPRCIRWTVTSGQQGSLIELKNNHKGTDKLRWPLGEVHKTLKEVSFRFWGQERSLAK